MNENTNARIDLLEGKIKDISSNIESLKQDVREIAKLTAKGFETMFKHMDSLKDKVDNLDKGSATLQKTMKHEFEGVSEQFKTVISKIEQINSVTNFESLSDNMNFIQKKNPEA